MRVLSEERLGGRLEKVPASAEHDEMKKQCRGDSNGEIKGIRCKRLIGGSMSPRDPMFHSNQCCQRAGNSHGNE
jgi:hypothetical protein